MKSVFRKFTAGLAVLFVFLFSAAFSADTLEKSFPVGPGGSVTLISSDGSVTLEGSERGDVHLLAEAKKDLDEYYSFNFDQSGDSLVIRIERKTQSVFFNLIKVTGSAAGLKFTLSVPKKFNAHIKTGGGKIDVGSLEGCVEAATSGGNIRVEHLTGSLDAKTSGGPIECEDISGPINIRTSGGRINLSGIRGDFEAKTSGGPIRAENLTGDGSLSTSGGSVSVDSCRGAINLHSSGGSISVSRLAGRITAHTSGGGITVELIEPPTGDCELSTSGGSISLTLPRESGAYVSARTSGGRIKTGLPIMVEGETGHGRLEGKLGAGGPNLTLRTSGGGISIDPVE